MIGNEIKLSLFSWHCSILQREKQLWATSGKFVVTKKSTHTHNKLEHKLKTLFRPSSAFCSSLFETILLSLFQWCESALNWDFVKCYFIRNCVVSLLSFRFKFWNQIMKNIYYIAVHDKVQLNKNNRGQKVLFSSIFLYIRTRSKLWQYGNWWYRSDFKEFFLEK